MTQLPRRTCTWLLVVAASLCSLLSNAAEAHPYDVERALLDRLGAMEAIARDKFRRGAPIEDPAREAVVLADMRSQGARYGLTEESVERLGRAAIDAAKSIQAHWHIRWTGLRIPAGPVAPNTLRETIDQATARLLLGLAVLGTPSDDAAGRTRRAAAWQDLHVSPAASGALETALTGVTRRPPATHDNGLDWIRARAVLRIGVPGDYAPFASPAPPAASNRFDNVLFLGAPLVGIDIALASQLAADLGVQALIVPTRWADLSNDLAEQRFDIALGGVTRTLQRQYTGLFTTTYFEDGKGAIGRCSDVARFTDFASVDRPGVRVLVNAGGGNQRFVQERVKHATVTVLQNNLDVFPALLRGDGDVMFTDTVEIRWQMRENNGLCALLGGARLNSLHKAMYVGRDPILRDYLDLWLAEARASGRLDALINPYLP